MLLLVLFSAFSLQYITRELFLEQHVSRLALIILLASVGLLSGLLQRNQHRGLTTSLLLGTALLLFLGANLTNNLFYQGVHHYQELHSLSNEDLSFFLDSDADIEITTAEAGANEPFRVLIDGNFKKQDIQQFSTNDQQSQISLTLDQRSLFDIFTKTNQSEIIVFIPKNTKLDAFELKLLKGDLRLIDISTENLKLELIDGDLFGKSIFAEQATITSETGDIVIEKSHLNATLANRDGKTIMTTISGNLSIDGRNGHTILKAIESTESDIFTKTGKITLEDSQIAELTASAKSGQTVIARTRGKLDLQSETGKIVAESNQGELRVNNKEGVTVIIDTEGTSSQVSSETGLIKWIHDVQNPLDFILETDSGEIRNELSEKQHVKGTQAKLTTLTGEIRLIEKVN